MKFISTVAIIFMLVPSLVAQEWVVPDDRKGKLSPFPFDENTTKAGEKLYLTNCLSCHGSPGKGNYLNLVPVPGDPATEKIQKNSDGEIFYKLQTGRGQMPAFRSVLSATEIWHVIAYIRSYNKSYRQQVAVVITSTAYPGAEIMLQLAYNSADTTVDISATAVSPKGSVPVTGAEMRLLIHRKFGHLPVDEPRATDSRGFVRFKLPDDLPGDTAGNVLLMARFTDEEAFGTASKDTIINAGVPTIPVSLVKERAMWNSARKAPLWIMITYLGGVLIAWGFIMLVLLKLRDIYIVGETLSEHKPEKDLK